jgi:hypothetical protein
MYREEFQMQKDIERRTFLAKLVPGTRVRVHPALRRGRSCLGEIVAVHSFYTFPYLIRFKDGDEETFEWSSIMLREED